MKIKITNFKGWNPVLFSHITQGSIHETIEPPNDGEYGTETKRGEVWILSATGKPMKLLAKEYEKAVAETEPE